MQLPRHVLAALVLSALTLAAQSRPAAPSSLRLYVFDGGVIRGINPETFHLKKDQIKQADMVVSSYLIVHPKGTLIWDTGAIPDSAIKDDGSVTTQQAYSASKSLKGQLAAIGYKPEDISFFALSHLHSDHTANANAFARATWIVQRPERDAMFAEKPPRIALVSSYNQLKDAKTQVLDGQDYDVFGDGSVVIKAAPGHTPGHQVLFLRLPKTGPVILAGDLYHYQEERGTDLTPTFEFDHDASLKSRAAIEAFGKSAGAQLWIEHDLDHFNTMTKSPAFYE